MRALRLILVLTLPASLSPLPGLAAQKRAMTFEDYISLPVVSDPQLSPDGQWVAYTVSTPSLTDATARNGAAGVQNH